jgi:Protein of unknown function (DUF4240)
MTAVLKMNIQEVNTEFVENLKRQFGHSELEIYVREQPSAAPHLTVKEFWRIIQLLDWSKEGDDALVTEPAVQALQKESLAYIYRFADILAEKLWHLDTKNHAQVFLDNPEEEGYLSVDDFLYARCAVVANGEHFYEKIWKKPSDMPTELTFEPLLYIAADAYARKTGKEFTSIPAFNYETYSNKKGWS